MQPVTVSGSIYMLLSNNDVLKFDAYTEKWKVFSSPIPYDIYGYSNPSIVLVKYDGRLGLVCESTNANDCWEIWVLKMNGLMWEKEDVAVEISKSEWGLIKALYGTDTIVMVDGNTLVFYRFKQHGNDMISKVVLNGIPCRMFSFRSYFEPVDGAATCGIEFS
ncbi:uncharacterized protein LOC143630218 [Bidens hawaiensis]|uniref:uncharacterized protein LOC143630218 n=1 Tax=Bidens hawaiensis TaxID=980011 RepID=UPI00404B58D8